MTNMLWLLGGVMGFVLIALVYHHTRSSLLDQKGVLGRHNRIMEWCIKQVYQFPQTAGWLAIGFFLIGIPLGIILNRYGISISLVRFFQD